jgi:hypothetical protein
MRDSPVYRIAKLSVQDGLMSSGLSWVYCVHRLDEARAAIKY